MHKTSRLVTIITLLTIILCAATVSTRAETATTVPRFEVADCPFEMPQGETIECGYLLVPENRTQPNGQTIRIFVAIVKSHSPTPEPDPILYIDGGPGGLTETLIDTLPRFDIWLAKRDLILFDQRGVGWSQPALDCPEVKDVTLRMFLGANPTLEERLAPRRTCRDRWQQQGVDLTAYNSLELAADVVDLWLALGYEQVNIYGVSYGTIPAQIIMRDYDVADSVRSVILDSAVPLTVPVMAETPALVSESITRLFAECAADFFCRTAYPDLEAVYLKVIDHLKAKPETLSAINPLTNEPFSFRYDIADFGYDVIYEHYRGLPKLIYDTYDGNYQQVITGREQFLYHLNERNSEDAFVLRNTINCNEPWQTISPEQEAAMQIYPEAAFFDLTLDLAICEEWPTFPFPEQQPVVSDIPTLILLGEYDTRMIGFGELLAASLSRSYVLRVPGAPHNVLGLGGTCPNLIALSFLDAPTQVPDDGCLATVNRSPFDTRFVIRAEAMHGPARGFLGGLSLLALGLIGFVGARMRRYALSGWRPGLAWRGSFALIGHLPLLGSALLVGLTYLAIRERLLPFEALDAVAIILPLLVAIQAAFLVSPEDEPALEVILSTPRPPAWTILERLLTLFAAQGIVGLVATLLLSYAIGQSPLLLVGRWLPLFFLLTGLTVVIALATRRAILGVWVVSLIWLLLALFGDFLTDRWPVAWVVDLYLSPGHSAYLLNRLLLTLTGLVLLILALAGSLDSAEYLLLGQRRADRRRPVSMTASPTTPTGRPVMMAASPRKMMLVQLGAMIRYEFLLQWRRTILPALVAALVVTPILGVFVEMDTFQGYRAALANGTLTPEVARVNITARLVPITWLGIALISMVMLPLAVANAIPRDRELGVRELLDALPLPPGVYLAGKLLSLWLSLWAGLLLATVVSSGVWWLLVGPFNLSLYLELWLISAALLIFINAGLSLLLAAGQPTTRRAMMVGAGVMLLLLMGLGLALVGTGWWQWLNPARPMVHLYYVLGFPGALEGNDEQTRAIVEFVQQRANPRTVRLTLAAGLAQVGLIWLIVWQWLKRR